jgi:hypothetical protein
MGGGDVCMRCSGLSLNVACSFANGALPPAVCAGNNCTAAECCVQTCSSTVQQSLCSGVIAQGNGLAVPSMSKLDAPCNSTNCTVSECCAGSCAICDSASDNCASEFACPAHLSYERRTRSSDDLQTASGLCYSWPSPDYPPLTDSCCTSVSFLAGQFTCTACADES